MMKRSFVVSILLLSVLTLSACGVKVIVGSGKIVTEDRQVSQFEAVSLSGSGDVIIQQGDREELKITAEDNLMPYIRTEVRGRTLHIFFDPRRLVFVNPTRPIKIYLSMRDVRDLELSGSGSLYSEKIVTDNLDIDISGSGEVTVDDLKADGVKLDISGSGRCRLKGEVDRQTLNISGSGSCQAGELQSRETVIDVSGSGKIEVNAAEKLRVDISGSGDVIYSGKPQISQSVSGSGRLSAK
jgi:predicted small secreted protein